MAFKIRVFLTVFYCVVQAQAQNIDPNGYNKFYYSNGIVSSEGSMVNGKPDGYWKTYSETGLIKSEGNRKNSQLDSVWHFYDEKGQLSSEISYKKGKKEGERKYYDTAKKLVLIENYTADVKQGMAYYFKDSVKIKEVPFVAGKEDGIGKEFNKDGKITAITTYKYGFVNKEERINKIDGAQQRQGVWKEFYSCKDGCENKIPVTQREYTYKDGQLDGYLKEYDSKGNVIKTEKYVKGQLILNAKELVKMDVRNDFHPNGKLKTSGTYKNGIQEGVMRIYDDQGKIIDSKIYKDGIVVSEGIYDERGFQQGKWKEYYLTGELKSTGEYVDGKKMGEWIYYHQNGKVEQKGKYAKGGKPTGDWRWYYESGNILREEKFDKGKEDGIMIEYSDTGTVVTKGEYIEGEREGLWITHDGEKTEEGNYKTGNKDGKWTIRFANGKKYFEGEFVDGNENGKHSYYHENGKISQECSYVMGIRDGTWKRFDYEGVQTLIVQYENGVETKVDGLKVIVPEELGSKDESAKPKK